MASILQEAGHRVGVFSTAYLDIAGKRVRADSSDVTSYRTLLNCRQRWLKCASPKLTIWY